jgi:hypothetical protein
MHDGRVVCVYRCAHADVCVAICVTKATSVMSYEDLCAAFMHFRMVPGVGGVESMNHWLKSKKCSSSRQHGESVPHYCENVLVRFHQGIDSMSF